MNAGDLFLELFPCSGGMAEGFRRAGIVFDLAFDKSADACDAYEKNHGHRPVQMDVHDLLEMARRSWLPGRSVRLLVADPPCTPWSRAGKRLGTDDHRDALEATCELIALLRPSAYLIGNVPGLEDAPNLEIVQRLIGGLGRHGYCTADFARLDAADYGVPQHRIRPFWFGHLDGPCIRWPHATHTSPEDSRQMLMPGIEPLQPWRTCRDALGHLSLEDLGKPVRLRWRHSIGAGKNARASGIDDPAGTLTCRQNGDGNIVTLRPCDHRPSEADEPAKTLTTNNYGDGALLVNSKHRPSVLDEPSKVIVCGDRGGAQGGRTIEGAWPWSRPATTVVTRGSLAKPGHHTTGHHKASNAIKLSELAGAILQGFPESWCFSGRTKKDRWSQIGQAMPPGLAEAVARSVARQMGLYA